MQSTINPLQHGKGHAVRTIMVLGVVSIDHTALGYASCCMAISTALLAPLLHVQHFLLCKYQSTCSTNTCTTSTMVNTVATLHAHVWQLHVIEHVHPGLQTNAEHGGQARANPPTCSCYSWVKLKNRMSLDANMDTTAYIFFSSTTTRWAHSACMLNDYPYHCKSFISLHILQQCR